MSDKEKAQWLSDRWAEVAQGGVWEECDHGWFEAPGGPSPEDTMLHTWRVVMPPVAKVINLSVLIESGIDCEFWDDISMPIRVLKLWDIVERGGLQYLDTDGAVYWKYCQPRMNHWHSWQGGECPVPEGYDGEAMLRSGKLMLLSEVASWDRRELGSDVICFRVTEIIDGYCMPWEVES